MSYGKWHQEPPGKPGSPSPARGRGRSFGRPGVDVSLDGRRPLSVHQFDFARPESVTTVHLDSDRFAGVS
jgi:hypothetical protein